MKSSSTQPKKAKASNVGSSETDFAIQSRMACGARVLIAVALFWLPSSTVQGEVISPSVHWGALAYPDAAPLLSLDFTINRFTRFGEPGPYNSILETSGFNFATLSWTRYFQKIPDLSTNLTIGGGPTRDEPSKTIQDWGHHIVGGQEVPVGLKREANDFMIDASATKWWNIGAKRTLFAGFGASTGSLYHELFARAGMRRGLVPGLSFMRWSIMGRAGQLFGGSAFHQVAPQSYLGQASIAVGNYDETNHPVWWEIEAGWTIDSGLFVGGTGNTLEEHFGAVTLRLGGITLETWNDSFAPPKWGAKDNGPTYGGRVMINIIRIRDDIAYLAHKIKD
jgi:hypothetical protein